MDSVSPVRSSPAILSRTVLVLGDELALVNQLRVLLGREYGCSVEAAPSVDRVVDLVKAGETPTVFVPPHLHSQSSRSVSRRP